MSFEGGEFGNYTDRLNAMCRKILRDKEKAGEQVNNRYIIDVEEMIRHAYEQLVRFAMNDRDLLASGLNSLVVTLEHTGNLEGNIVSATASAVKTMAVERDRMENNEVDKAEVATEAAIGVAGAAALDNDIDNSDVLLPDFLGEVVTTESIENVEKVVGEITDCFKKENPDGTKCSVLDEVMKEQKDNPDMLLYTFTVQQIEIFSAENQTPESLGEDGNGLKAELLRHMVILSKFGTPETDKLLTSLAERYKLEVLSKDGKVSPEKILHAYNRDKKISASSFGIGYEEETAEEIYESQKSFVSTHMTEENMYETEEEMSKDVVSEGEVELLRKSIEQSAASGHEILEDEYMASIIRKHPEQAAILLKSVLESNIEAGHIYSNLEREKISLYERVVLECMKTGGTLEDGITHDDEEKTDLYKYMFFDEIAQTRYGSEPREDIFHAMAETDRSTTVRLLNQILARKSVGQTDRYEDDAIGRLTGAIQQHRGEFLKGDREDVTGAVAYIATKKPIFETKVDDTKVKDDIRPIDDDAER